MCVCVCVCVCVCTNKEGRILNYIIFRDITYTLQVHVVFVNTFRLNKMFWSDFTDGTINQANLDGSNPTVIVANITRPSECQSQ